MSQSDSGQDQVVETDPTGRYVRGNEELGRGASKIVYRAIDRDRGLEVAWNQIKLSRSVDLDKLYKEIQLLQSLNHPNIIIFYHSWVDEEKLQLNFITECMTSGTLRQFIRKATKVKLRVIKNWCIQILEGLNYLHTRPSPIIHRDIKCDNIFINGTLGEVKIGDLGLATIATVQAPLSIIGTPEFMAPEFYEEKYNEKVDIWAFGLAVLEMVTLEYPYSECSNPASIFKKVSSGQRPRGIARIKDPEVFQFLLDCLTNPRDRKSAAQLLRHPFLTNSDDDKNDRLLDMRSDEEIDAWLAQQDAAVMSFDPTITADMAPMSPLSDDDKIPTNFLVTPKQSGSSGSSRPTSMTKPMSRPVSMTKPMSPPLRGGNSSGVDSEYSDNDLTSDDDFNSSADLDVRISRNESRTVSRTGSRGESPIPVAAFDEEFDDIPSRKTSSQSVGSGSEKKETKRTRFISRSQNPNLPSSLNPSSAVLSTSGPPSRLLDAYLEDSDDDLSLDTLHPSESEDSLTRKRQANLRRQTSQPVIPRFKTEVRNNDDASSDMGEDDKKQDALFAIPMKLRLTTPEKTIDIEFEFHLLTDTATGVAIELIHELGLPEQHTNKVSSYIQNRVDEWVRKQASVKRALGEGAIKRHFRKTSKTDFHITASPSRPNISMGDSNRNPAVPEEPSGSAESGTAASPEHELTTREKHLSAGLAQVLTPRMTHIDDKAMKRMSVQVVGSITPLEVSGQVAEELKSKHDSERKVLEGQIQALLERQNFELQELERKKRDRRSIMLEGDRRFEGLFTSPEMYEALNNMGNLPNSPPVMLPSTSFNGQGTGSHVGSPDAARSAFHMYMNPTQVAPNTVPVQATQTGMILQPQVNLAQQPIVLGQPASMPVIPTSLPGSGINTPELRGSNPAGQIPIQTVPIIAQPVQPGIIQQPIINQPLPIVAPTQPSVQTPIAVPQIAQPVIDQNLLAQQLMGLPYHSSGEGSRRSSAAIPPNMLMTPNGLMPSGSQTFVAQPQPTPQQPVQVQPQQVVDPNQQYAQQYTQQLPQQPQQVVDPNQQQFANQQVVPQQPQVQLDQNLLNALFLAPQLQLQQQVTLPNGTTIPLQTLLQLYPQLLQLGVPQQQPVMLQQPLQIAQLQQQLAQLQLQQNPQLQQLQQLQQQQLLQQQQQLLAAGVSMHGMPSQVFVPQPVVTAPQNPQVMQQMPNISVVQPGLPQLSVQTPQVSASAPVTPINSTTPMSTNNTSGIMTNPTPDSKAPLVPIETPLKNQVMKNLVTPFFPHDKLSYLNDIGASGLVSPRVTPSMHQQPTTTTYVVETVTQSDMPNGHADHPQQSEIQALGPQS
jgi:WNK lysine deficient protein kinase